jgi:hypothetical protein
MPWVIFYVALAVAGFAVLGVVGYRLWLNARELGRAVSAASHRLADAAAELEAAAAQPPGQRGERGPLS